MNAKNGNDRPELVFDLLSVLSVQHFAESLGYDTHFRRFSTIVSSDALNALTEDVNYRLRELANKAVLFSRQRRRQRLSVDDFNEALKWSGCEKLLGHSSRETPKLHYVKELNIFVRNDGILDAPMLAVSNLCATTKSTSSLILGHWQRPTPSLDIPADSWQRLDQLSCRVLQKCFSCAFNEFYNNALVLKQIASEYPGATITLLNRISQTMKENVRNIRILRCLLAVVQNAVLAKTNMFCYNIGLMNNVAETLISSLGGICDDNIDFTEIDLKCQILSCIARKYEISANFEIVLSQKLDNYKRLSMSGVCVLLKLLRNLADPVWLVKRSEDIVDKFQQFMIEDLLNICKQDWRLQICWKSFIDSFCQWLIRQNSEGCSSIDRLLGVLLFLRSEAFADGCCSSITIMETTDSNCVNEHLARTFLSNCYRPYFNNLNASMERPKFDDCSTPQSRANINKRRKRRREVNDLFDIPKRLRLSHQRDIIFVFHHTPASVRSVSLGIVQQPDHLPNLSFDQIASKCWSRIRQRRLLGTELSAKLRNSSRRPFVDPATAVL